MDKPIEKPVKNITELPVKQAAMILLADNGVKKVDICNSLGYKPDSYDTLQSKLRKFTFTGNLRSQKVAFKTINSLAAGKVPRNCEIVEVKDSTAFQAAKYISDHNDPVVQHVRTQNESVIAVVDYSKYK